jgi:hypothetical protein
MKKTLASRSEILEVDSIEFQLEIQAWVIVAAPVMSSLNTTADEKSERPIYHLEPGADIVL